MRISDWSSDVCSSDLLPMISVLRNYDCVLTGRKRFQTAERAGMDYVEVQETWLRVNPLADWSHAQIRSFLAEKDLARHPLVREGYPSLGCEPCIRKSDPSHTGRWAFVQQTRSASCRGRGCAILET